MASMYDTIMELPLFKGIGVEQLSAMLEKTSMEFIKYGEGEKIITAGQRVTHIDFIISGKILKTYNLENFDIGVQEIIGEGGMTGIQNLYGLMTHYPYSADALGAVSIMRMKKSQYMNILLSDRIYLLNIVNYLSAAEQKTTEMFLHNGVPSIERTLINLAYSIASRSAERIMISGSDEELARYLGVTDEEFATWKTEMSVAGRIQINGQKKLIIEPTGRKV